MWISALRSTEIIDNTGYNPIKTDIWSLGVPLYNAVSGCTPWNSSDIKDIT